MHEPEPDTAPEAALLFEPADGIPETITTSDQLTALCESMRAGTGPVAFDAERASGYRYSQRAYLVQLRREGVGTALIDPISLPALSGLNDAIGDAEWILHAANQDLPCLAELGLHPSRLFDTELAGRLLGEERVALGTMVEQYLGVRLEKGYSAADWSTRPLPREWLAYAALDVELLIPLRNVIAERLATSGKSEWAEQEFEAVRRAPAPAPRVEPWRRTSGIHKLRHRRQLAVIRALWQARDSYAAQRDIAPGRVLPDSAIVDAARKLPKSKSELSALAVYGGPRQRRQLGRWFEAIERARAIPEPELPTLTASVGEDSVPPAARWRDRDPVAAARLSAARAVVTALAEQHAVLAQNLLASDVLRRLAWAPPPVPQSPEGAAERAVRERLVELGARAWQVRLVAEPLVGAMRTEAADP